MRSMRAAGGCCLAVLLAGCAVPAHSSLPAASAARPAPGGSKAMEFVGFWESWSDTNAKDAFHLLGSVPRGVTTVDVAFSIADSNEISPPQNYYPLGPGAKKIHARGGKVLLSFGGATSQFGISDATQFAANLQSYVQSNPSIYDGFDFDDEVIPWNGPQQLTNVLLAVRAAFPKAVITFDAFIDGADPGPPSGHQGEDISIVQQAAGAIDYLNVMAYDQYGWKPTTNPNCSYRQGSADDCRLDVLSQFASIQLPGGGTFPKNKIGLGLMIGQADDGIVVSPHDASGYGAQMKNLGYRGIMIWDVDLDNAQAPPNGTGHRKGTYVRTISKALGT